jgi:PAS domain S-box-containing protein
VKGAMEEFGSSAPPEWAVLEAIADGVLVADSDGVILFVSERLAGLLGYLPVELVGGDIEVLVDAKARRSHQRARVDFAGSPRVRPMGIGLDIRARHKDGTLVPVDIHLHPLGSNGLIIASVRDVREAQVAERQYQHLSDRERDARALLDLVVQRLFGISATIAALSADTTPAVGDRLMSSAMLIDDTVQLIRSVALESTVRRENLAPTQSGLLARSSRGARDDGPDTDTMRR